MPRRIKTSNGGTQRTPIPWSLKGRLGRTRWLPGIIDYPKQAEERVRAAVLETIQTVPQGSLLGLEAMPIHYVRLQR